MNSRDERTVLSSMQRRSCYTGVVLLHYPETDVVCDNVRVQRYRALLYLHDTSRDKQSKSTGRIFLAVTPGLLVHRAGAMSYGSFLSTGHDHNAETCV